MAQSIGILRLAKIKDFAGLAARDAHNRRSKNVPNADTERRSQNLNLRPDLPQSASMAFDIVRKRLGDPKLRKNGVIGIEHVITFSAEAAEHIDELEFANAALAFVEARHGAENILSAHLHRDERTPHIHVIAAPVFAGSFVVGPFMGSPGILRKAQDDFHAQVSSRFGLARRSANPTGRPHIPMRELRTKSSECARPFEEAKRRVERVGDGISIEIRSEPVSTPALLTAKGREAFVKSIEVAATTRLAEVRDRIVRTAVTTLDELRQLVESAVLLGEENQAMKRYQLESVRDIPLELIVERYLGVTPHREGGSLVAETDDHKIVVTGSKFKDFKADQGALGGGAIDLTMHLIGCDFRRAIEVLAHDFPAAVAGAVRSHHFLRAAEETAAAKAAPRRLGFAELRARFAEPTAAKLATVRRYLVEERMLPEALVDRVIASGDLWANKWGSCVFAHRGMSGEIEGCSIRATLGSFRQTLGAKNSAWFLIGSPLGSAGRLVLTESAIDALSYEALGLCDARDAVVSTAGQTGSDDFLVLGKPLVLAQDADDAGDLQAEEIRNAAVLSGLSVERRRPTRGKDWNEELIYDRDQLRQIVQDVECRERGANAEKQGPPRAVATNTPGIRSGCWPVHPGGRSAAGRRMDK